MCYGLDLFYNCYQNASLPFDSKSFSNNFVLSLSFSSLTDSFCCLIITCIKSKLSLKYFFNGIASEVLLLKGKLSFFEVFVASSWFQILLENLHYSEPAEVIMIKFCTESFLQIVYLLSNCLSSLFLQIVIVFQIVYDVQAFCLQG